MQAGAYTLMQRLNELPQDKTINIMLCLTLWAFGLVGLWFDFLVPEPVAPEADKEKVEKDRKTAFGAGRGGNGRYSGDFCDAGYHRKHNPLCARIIVRADSRKVIGFSFGARIDKGAAAGL